MCELEWFIKNLKQSIVVFTNIFNWTFGYFYIFNILLIVLVV